MMLNPRAKAVALRILRQFRHDRRTLALMFVAPLLLLTLVYLILNSNAGNFSVGIVNAPLHYVENLQSYDVKTVYCSPWEATDLLERGKIDASVEIRSGKAYITLDGSDAATSQKLLTYLEAAEKPAAAVKQSPASDVTYLYGGGDLEAFDHFGAALIGIIIFFFVFLVSGISFLQERTTGTLERLLASPIRRWELVVGYAAGFGVVAAVQSVLVTFYVIYVLKVMMAGSVFLVLLIVLLAAMTALTMGILASTLAATEFQIMQFIPLVIIPQVVFSGLFPLTGIWEYLGYLMPLYYVADALTEIMLRGGGFSHIAGDVAVLLCLCLGFIALNTKLLRRHRRI